MISEKIVQATSLYKDKGQFRYLLSLGSNLGNRQKNCRVAFFLLKKIAIIKNKSPLVETFPLKSDCYETKDHSPYLNQIIEIESSLNPEDLYKKLRVIEDYLGHSRFGKWRPRHMDLDILLWRLNDHSLFTSCRTLKYQRNGLVVPHAETRNRPFLLNLIKGEYPKITLEYN